MADIDMTAGHFGNEISVIRAQMNAVKAKNPEADLNGLESAVDALATKHTAKLNEAFNRDAPKPVSTDPLGPKPLASDPPPVVPASTPENTPRITPQNVSIPLSQDDPNPYPFPNKTATLPTEEDQANIHNNIVTTAPNSAPDTAPAPGFAPTE